MKPGIIAFISFLCFFALSLKAQTTATPVGLPEKTYPWANNQLMEPADLNALLTAPNGSLPVIFNIGAVEDIKGARHIGAVNNAPNLEAFKKQITNISKSTQIIIYCGCCPFTRCPNIQPAFLTLKKLGFTNIKVLNLPVNLKTNWIARGYPLDKTVNN